MLIRVLGRELVTALAVRLTVGSSPVGAVVDLIADVFGSRSPPKIRRRVVGLVAVEMPDLLIDLGSSAERFCDEPVNVPMCTMDAHGKVSVSVVRWAQDEAVRTSYATLVTYLVSG